MAYTAKDPRRPWRFLYLTETTSWRWEGGEGEGKKVSLKSHATARGMGKKHLLKLEHFFFTIRSHERSVHIFRLREGS